MPQTSSPPNLTSPHTSPHPIPNRIPNHPQPSPAMAPCGHGYWVYLERGVDAVRRWKAFSAADQRRLEANAPLAEELVEEEEDEEGGWWGALGGITSGYVKIAIENDHL